jgi:hypothetical protein
MNRAIRAAFDCGSQEPHRVHCGDLFYNRSKPSSGCPASLVLDDPASHSAGFKNRRMGKTFWVTASPILDGSGELDRDEAADRSRLHLVHGLEVTTLKVTPQENDLAKIGGSDAHAIAEVGRAWGCLRGQNNHRRRACRSPQAGTPEAGETLTLSRQDPCSPRHCAEAQCIGIMP